MEIKSDDIRIVISANGWIIIGVEKPNTRINNKVTLDFPFRIIPIERGVAFGAIVTKEKFVSIDLHGALEPEVNSQMQELYLKYYEQEFGSGLILPNNRVVV